MRLRAASMGSSLLSPAYLTHFSLKTNSHILRTEPIKTPFPFPLSPFPFPPKSVYFLYGRTAAATPDRSVLEYQIRS